MLHDENSWVQYDSAWIIKDNGLMNAVDEIVLRKIADKYLGLSDAELDNIKPSEASDYAAKMASMALNSLNV